ncbi:hypothetical protein ABZU76_49105 [Amycolatopsis sp. NPDC005232]|uniref:hypothetical protein n=1 Tax=Amycolatopsis sp. NPDC005232 TaxID=3157027 RepID=UPI0033B4084A
MNIAGKSAADAMLLASRRSLDVIVQLLENRADVATLRAHATELTEVADLLHSYADDLDVDIAAIEAAR